MLRKLSRLYNQRTAPVRRRLRVFKNQVRHSRPLTEADVSGKFLLVRIMGNDLYPRHGEGQMLANLRFILENEPQFPNCEKIFILNRMFDLDRQDKALALIERHGAEPLLLPFDPVAYARTGWDTEVFGGENFFESEEFRSQSRTIQDQMRLWACASKIRYAVNINGARNAAIMAGRGRAEWTAVLDGNCVFTAASFEKFRDDCMADPFAPYVVLPMHRLEHNSAYGSTEPDPKSPEEPQIAFHDSARQMFDERFPYGLRNKTELLRTLGVPGPWHFWTHHKWLPEGAVAKQDRHFYKISSGAVFRLSSGGSGFELGHAHSKRYGARNFSILTTIRRLNAEYGTLNPKAQDKIIGEAVLEPDEKIGEPVESRRVR